MIRHCEICKKPFEVYTKIQKGHNPNHRYKRKSNSRTCSRYCSILWAKQRQKLIRLRLKTCKEV
jgi:hypothetical protein